MTSNEGHNTGEDAQLDDELRNLAAFWEATTPEPPVLEDAMPVAADDAATVTRLPREAEGRPARSKLPLIVGAAAAVLVLMAGGFALLRDTSAPTDIVTVESPNTVDAPVENPTPPEPTATPKPTAVSTSVPATASPKPTARETTPDETEPDQPEDAMAREVHPLVNTPCAAQPGRQDLALQVGNICAAVTWVPEAEFPGAGTTTVTSSTDTVAVAGDLVGLGTSADFDGVLMATIAPIGPTSETAPLVLHRITVDTAGALDVASTELPVTGFGPAFSVGKVSFFDGGMVLTNFIDLSVSFEALDFDGQPLSDMRFPTDADLGYPPDPWTTLASVSQDGSLVAWVEQPDPRDPEGPLPEGTLVVAATATGETVARAPIEAPVQFNSWLDFDGRWALLSRRGPFDQDDPSVLIDTTTGDNLLLTSGATTLRRASASQSPDDALRDGVHPAVAELTFDQRMDIRAEVTAQGQTWAISAFPNETRSLLIDQGLAGPELDPSGGELVRLENGRIVRSISMNGFPPTWIWTDGQYVIGARGGDGGAPNAGFVRVRVDTGEVERFMVPRPYRNAGPDFFPGWPPVAPGVLEPLWAALDDNDTDAVMTHLNAVFDMPEYVDLSTLPVLHDTCFTEGETEADIALQVLNICAISGQGPGGAESTSFSAGSDATFVPGRLLGFGQVADRSGAMAVTLEPGDSIGSRSLRLHQVLVDDAGEVQVTSDDLKITGHGSEFSVSKVSFFDGGMILNQVADTVTFSAWSLDGVPLDDVALPGDPDPGDPWREQVAITADGTRLAWLEGLDADTGEATLVVVPLTTDGVGSELRFPIDVGSPAWLDFDGEWALISTTGTFTPTKESVLIDTATGRSYPQGFSNASTFVR